MPVVSVAFLTPAVAMSFARCRTLLLSSFDILLPPAVVTLVGQSHQMFEISTIVLALHFLLDFSTPAAAASLRPPPPTTRNGSGITLKARRRRRPLNLRVAQRATCNNNRRHIRSHARHLQPVVLTRTARRPTHIHRITPNGRGNVVQTMHRGYRKSREAPM